MTACALVSPPGDQGICNHPRNIRGRRKRRFADVEHERDNQKGRIRYLAGHGFSAAVVTGQARDPDA